MYLTILNKSDPEWGFAFIKFQAVCSFAFLSKGLAWFWCLIARPASILWNPSKFVNGVQGSVFAQEHDICNAIWDADQISSKQYSRYLNKKIQNLRGPMRIAQECYFLFLRKNFLDLLPPWWSCPWAPFLLSSPAIEPPSFRHVASLGGFSKCPAELVGRQTFLVAKH